MSAVVDVLVLLVVGYYGLGLAAGVALLWLRTSASPQRDAAEMNNRRQNEINRRSVRLRRTPTADT